MKTNVFTRIITIVLVMALVMSLGVTAYAAEAPEIIDETSYIENTKANTAVLMSEDTDIEKIDFIPLYNQRDYAHVNYGTGNIHDGGCGLVALWMVATYLNNEIYDINDLAAQFGDKYYIKGSGTVWGLFMGSAEELGLNLIESDSDNGEWYNWSMVIEALKNGQPVICLQRAGIFTRGGHYIVLTGITEDGKILVNDPNGYKWTENQTMVEGFAHGFTEWQVRDSAIAYWIYGEKVENEGDGSDVNNRHPIIFVDARDDAQKTAK